MDSNARMDVVVGPSLPGNDGTVYPQKGTMGHADPSAIREIKRSPLYKSLMSDLQNGKIIVFLNNGDRRLNDMLLRQVFDPTSGGPVVVSHRTSDPQSRLVAKAIARVSGTPACTIFSVLADSPLQLAQVEDAVYQQYLTAQGVAAERAASNARSGPRVAEESADAPGTWYYWSGMQYVADDSGHTVGRVQWGYVLTRVYTNAKDFSLWGAQRYDVVTPGGTMSDGGDEKSRISAVWESVGITNGRARFEGENVVDFGPSGTTGGGTLSWTFADAGVPSRYAYTIDPDAVVTNMSDAGIYGAWSTAYTANGGIRSATLKPGAQIVNTTGQMWVSGDIAVTFVPGFWTSHDLGDTWYVQDLP